MKKIALHIIFIPYMLLANDSSYDNMSLDELMNVKVYSATKNYKRVEEIPANIIIITRKDIKKYSYKTLSELLNSVPGLFVIDDTDNIQIGTQGSFGSSFKLMLNNNPILTNRIPNSATSNRNFFSIPIESIDKIEITKGAQAVTYGTNALYGSINVITNDFNEKNQVSIGKGNNGLEKIFTRINHKNENGGFTFNSSFYQTNGIEGELKDTLTPSYYQNRNPNAIQNLNKKTFKEYKTIDTSYRFKNLTASVFYTKTNYGFYFEPSFHEGNKVEQDEKQFALVYEDEINKNLSFKSSYIKSLRNYKIDKLNVIFENFNGNNDLNQKSDFLDFHLNYKASNKLSILLGASYEDAYNKNDAFLNNNKIYETNTLISKDLYTKINYKINPKLELNAGLRYYKNNKFTLGSNTFKAQDKELPEFSLIYHLNAQEHLKLIYGEATQLRYQSENLYEEISNLKVNYTYLSSKLFLTSSIFQNTSKNIHLFTYSSEQNIEIEDTEGSIKNQGFELNTKYQANDKLDLEASFVYQKQKNKSSILEAGFSPKILAKLKSSYLKDKTRYSFYINYISSMKSTVDPDRNERLGNDTASNITLNANINHKFSKNLDLNLHITNILDKDNRTPSGSSLVNFEKGMFTSGREFLFTLNYKF